MEKKILFVIPFYGDINNAIARRYVPIVEVFVANGYEVTILTSHNGKSIFGELVIKTRINIFSNKSHILMRFIKEIFWGIEVGLRIYMSSLSRLNTVVTSPSYIGFLVYSSFIKNSKKTVFDMRDIYPHVLWYTNIIDDSGLLGTFLRKVTEKKLLKFKKITTVSKGLLTEIYEWLGTTASLVYNGYPDEFSKISVKKKRVFTVVMHGTLGAAQNIELLIEVARYYENDNEIEFIVIGRGSEAHRLKNLAFVEYVEDLPWEELFRNIASCHLGLSLRIDGWLSQTALPVKVFEYLGLRLPVVATPPGEVSDLLIEDRLGRTVSNKLEEVVAAIEYYRANAGNQAEIDVQFSRGFQSKSFFTEYEELFSNK